MTKYDLNAARIGIDIGRVLMCPTSEQDGPDTSFLSGDLDQALGIPPAALSFEVIRQLVKSTGGHVWLVSKAGKRIRERTCQWLDRHRFFDMVGMEPSHLFFCYKRHEKRPIADRLGLTHFIDDRVDVLEHMRGALPHLMLFGVQTDPVPGWTRHVKDWHAVHKDLFGQELPLKAIQ